MTGAGWLPGPPVQVAYAVHDVRTAAEAWAARGVGPFVVADHIALASSRLDGAETPFDHSSAYGWWGEVMVELICDHAATPNWGLTPPRIHHVACFVDDVDDAVEEAAGGGWPEALRAVTTGGTTFAFCDARADLGHLVEVYVADEVLTGFYASVRRAAETWDGVEAFVRPA